MKSFTRTFLAASLLMVIMTAPAAAQMHADRSVEVALRVEAGRLLVPVEAADGTVFEFMLSTGTPPTVLSESTAARLGEHTALEIGGLPLDTEGMMTVPDDSLTVDGKVIAGMVGGQTLSQYDILIDAPGGRLVLKPFGRVVSWEGMKMSEPVRLQVYHGVILALEVEFNGEPYQATLDLGLSTLVINEALQTAMHLDVESNGTLGVGDTTFSNLAVRVRDLDAFDRWDPDGKGFVMVGAPMAEDCAISISWVHQELRTCVQ